MKITVCELPDNQEACLSAWKDLVAYLKVQSTELLLLPEMPFSAWFVRTPQFDARVWQRALAEHDAMMKRLPELAPAVVLGTRPMVEQGRHLNRAFFWTEGQGYTGVHDKYYFPNEEDFYEGNWFERSPRDFSVARVQDLAIGFLICTEVMFSEWARHYGKQGANIIAVPRATMSHQRWDIAPRMAAVASGAFVLSSNRVDEHLFGGRGLIINPEGEILAATSRQNPFVTVDIELEESARAKKTYPRDVLE